MSEKPNTKVTVFVRNNSLDLAVFSDLCDFLNSRNHNWCSDYRYVKDFHLDKERPYWQSYTVDVGNYAYWNAILQGVQWEVNVFCRRNNLPMDSVEVEAVKHN